LAQAPESGCREFCHAARMGTACCKSDGADPPEYTETYVKPSTDPEKEMDGSSLFPPAMEGPPVITSAPEVAKEATAEPGSPLARVEEAQPSRAPSMEATAGSDPYDRFREAVTCYRHAEAYRYLVEAEAMGPVPQDLAYHCERTKMMNTMYRQLTDRLASITNPQTTSNWVKVEDKSIGAQVHYMMEAKALVVHAVAYFELPTCDPLKVFAALREFDMAPEWVPYVTQCQDIDQPCNEIGYYQCTQTFSVGIKSLKMDSCQRRVYSDALDEEIAALWFCGSSEAADAKEMDGKALPPPGKGVVRSPASLAATVAPRKGGGTRFVFVSQGDVPFRIPDWILGVVCKFLVRGFVKGMKNMCENQELSRRMQSGPRAALYSKLGERLAARKEVSPAA